ncbi:uncharacterized protein LODBEIA_P05210 [Lodderomyces beijingensis]|uniref:RING-type domain-containing protein n=1 Tax=Lodderomyces beijingensis TaxID=1775926 RepID=A0ABP0ZDQ4_9ASCO
MQRIVSTNSDEGDDDDLQIINIVTNTRVPEIPSHSQSQDTRTRTRTHTHTHRGAQASPSSTMANTATSNLRTSGYPQTTLPNNRSSARLSAPPVRVVLDPDPQSTPHSAAVNDTETEIEEEEDNDNDNNNEDDEDLQITGEQRAESPYIDTPVGRITHSPSFIQRVIHFRRPTPTAQQHQHHQHHQQHHHHHQRYGTRQTNLTSRGVGPMQPFVSEHSGQTQNAMPTDRFIQRQGRLYRTHPNSRPHQVPALAITERRIREQIEQAYMRQGHGRGNGNGNSGPSPFSLEEGAQRFFYDLGPFSNQAIQRHLMIGGGVGEAEFDRQVMQTIEEDNQRIIDDRIRTESEYNRKFLQSKLKQAEVKQSKNTHTTTIKAGELLVCELCGVVLGDGAPEDFKGDPGYNANFVKYTQEYNTKAPWFCVYPFTVADVDLSKRIFVAKCGHTYCGRCVRNIVTRPKSKAEKNTVTGPTIGNPQIFAPRTCIADDCGKRFQGKSFIETFF